MDELLELWTSVAAYDVTKSIGFCAFMLCIVLLWRIHDFLGYGIVGGFAYHGYAGCLWYRPKLGAVSYRESLFLENTGFLAALSLKKK